MGQATHAARVRLVAADDAPDSLALLRATLAERDGLDVVAVARDGADAVARVDELHPDLVVLDIAMPVMDGLEAATRVREIAPSTKILVLSAYSSDRMAGDARAAGADGYVEKGAGVDALLRAVGDLFPGVSLEKTRHAPRPAAVGAEAADEPFQARFRLLLDAIDEAVLIVDDDGVVVGCNFAASRLFARATSALVGCPLGECGVLRPHDDTRRVDDVVRSSVPVSHLAVDVRRPDGSVRHTLLSARPLPLADAAGAGETLLSLVDITELHAVQTLYETLVENLPDVAVFGFDRDLRFTLVGGQAQAMGWTADELIDRRVTELGLGDKATMLAERMSRALAGDRAHLHVTGSRVPDRVWDEEVVPMYAPDGEIVGGVIVTRDVSDAERLRQAMADNEAILRSSLDAMTEPFFRMRSVRDDEGRIVDFEYAFCNPPALALLQRDADAVIGHRLLELFPSHRPAGLFDCYVAVVETGESWRTEFPFDEGGVSGRFDVVVSRAGDGYVIVGREVAAALHEAEVRHDAELRMRAALETMFDSVVVCEAVRDDGGAIVDFRYVYANTTTRDVAGRRADEIIGHLQSELYPGLRGSDRFDRYCDLVKHGGVLTLEHAPYVSEPGGPVAAVFDIRATRLGDGFVATFRDVTDREHARAQLERQAGELARSNRELQDFASIAGHDMSEPLRTVGGFVALLRDGYADRLGDDGVELLGYIGGGVARLQRMLDDLLAYSRVESQGLPFAAVDLAAVATDAVAGLRAKVDQVAASVEIGPLPTVDGDAAQLTRLLQNLVANALTYVAPGTVPRVRISAAPDPAGWRIVVADNGIGIPVEDRDRVFEMFVRLRRLAGTDGTGIGLAVCARIVARHGGRIWVEDNPGGGSQVCFTLPLAPR